MDARAKDGPIRNQLGVGACVPILEAGARTGKSTTDVRAGSGIGEPGDPMYTLQSGKQHAVGFSCKDHGADATEELAPTLRSMGHSTSHANAGGQMAVAFHENQRGELSLNDTVGALNKGGGKPGQGYPAVALNLAPFMPQGERVQDPDGVAETLSCNPAGGMKISPVMQKMAVRRLTPVECERLQGFPDGYTAIPQQLYRQTRDGDWSRIVSDGPRYKALGNSMAVPVMAWIGKRIDIVDFCFCEDSLL